MSTVEPGSSARMEIIKSRIAGELLNERESASWTTSCLATNPVSREGRKKEKRRRQSVRAKSADAKQRPLAEHGLDPSVEGCNTAGSEIEKMTGCPVSAGGEDFYRVEVPGKKAGMVIGFGLRVFRFIYLWRILDKHRG